MLIKPNFTMIPKKVPVGVYPALIMKCESFKSQKGTVCLKWAATITDGEFQGRDLHVITPVEGKGAGVLADFLNCIDPNYVEGEFNTDNFINRPVWIQVEKYSAGYPVINAVRNYVAPEVTSPVVGV